MDHATLKTGEMMQKFSFAITGMNLKYKTLLLNCYNSTVLIDQINSLGEHYKHYKNLTVLKPLNNNVHI